MPTVPEGVPLAGDKLTRLLIPLHHQETAAAQIGPLQFEAGGSVDIADDAAVLAANLLTRRQEQFPHRLCVHARTP